MNIRPQDAGLRSSAGDDFLSRVDKTYEIVKWASDFYKPEGVGVWLLAPNTILGDRSPMDLIERGEHDEVLSLLGLMASGGG